MVSRCTTENEYQPLNYSDQGYGAGGGFVETRWWKVSSWCFWWVRQTVGWLPGRCGGEINLCLQVTYYSATSPVAHLDRLRLGKRYDFPFQYNLGAGGQVKRGKV